MTMLAQMSLQAGDYTLLAALYGLPVMLLVFNLRGLSKRVDRVEDRLKDVEEKKVAHRDWIRVVASQTSRQTQISLQLAELGGKIESTLGVTAGLNRVAKAVEESRSG